MDAKRCLPLIARIAKAKRRLPSRTRCTNDDYEPTRKTRQQQTRLDPEQASQLVADYQRGATVYELANRFECHRTTVSEHLKAHGVQMRHRPLTEEQIDEAVKLYESGLSSTKVGQQVGVDAGTVVTRLRERGVVTRDAHNRRVADSPFL